MRDVLDWKGAAGCGRATASHGRVGFAIVGVVLITESPASPAHRDDRAVRSYRCRIILGAYMAMNGADWTRRHPAGGSLSLDLSVSTYQIQSCRSAPRSRSSTHAFSETVARYTRWPPTVDGAPAMRTGLSTPS